MLVTKVDRQPTLWETILPPEFLRLPPGLSEIDRLLDDPVFFEPFEEFLDPEIGRPSIPMEMYLRMNVPALPLSPGFRDAVRGGGRLPRLAALQSHRADGQAGPDRGAPYRGWRVRTEAASQR